MPSVRRNGTQTFYTSDHMDSLFTGWEGAQDTGGDKPILSSAQQKIIDRRADKVREFESMQQVRTRTQDNVGVQETMANCQMDQPQGRAPIGRRGAQPTDPSVNVRDIVHGRPNEVGEIGAREQQAEFGYKYGISVSDFESPRATAEVKSILTDVLRGLGEQDPEGVLAAAFQGVGATISLREASDRVAVVRAEDYVATL